MNSERPAEPPGERRPGGALEGEVMAVLQAAPEALTPPQVREQLSGSVAYSTAVTVLSRLYDKGLLSRTRQGRAYAYTPVTDAHGLTARRMRQVMETDSDREAVLTRFVDDLAAGDEQLLRQLLGTDLPRDQ
ncbi:BlaI/MecI/CopY family transcriptional regulator [Streptomyces sp. H10-C2]|uniref:BlaI/MecI/CopY family transcriptional regulator n=1 Tax=unclassified Streptomyces TaxID=2593676 RepID=UPI0024BB9FD1|nr:MULTISPECIES: BlaI/MecI/CopY family transcriptional regulator [unclassified Streptomyces]MDJ0341752.1 BlaI/MecI/CopY family transcriptional regulator [Streptomyces sp. PH10-H1]MDJ0368940.1 BlaI/MecI/CopY family transcriptional regulator [Streptomyces sp. H10-C2]